MRLDPVQPLLLARARTLEKNQEETRQAPEFHHILPSLILSTALEILYGSASPNQSAAVGCWGIFHVFIVCVKLDGPISASSWPIAQILPEPRVAQPPYLRGIRGPLASVQEVSVRSAAQMDVVELMGLQLRDCIACLFVCGCVCVCVWFWLSSARTLFFINLSVGFRLRHRSD